MPFDPQLNYGAIAVATIAYFVIGFIWYTPLFGRVWAKQKGFDPDMNPSGGEMARSMALNLVGNLLVVFVFAHLLEAFTERAWDPNGAERTMADALEGAFWVWLGFFVSKELGALAWEKSTWTVAAINAGYQLVSMAAIAAILTAWM